MTRRFFRTMLWVTVAILIVFAALWLTGNGFEPVNEQLRSIWHDLAG
jgi:hypothetical protein